MKNIRLIIVTAAILFAGSILAKAQTADEIIRKHITAIGGADNWKKITSMNISGSFISGGKETPITVTTVNGKGSRTEFSINGMVCYSILTTTDGWAYFPIQGQKKPEALTVVNVKQSQDQLDIAGPLVDYRAKGNKVTYLGKDKVEGTDCYKIKVTYSTGKEETWYIDATNYYHIRSVEKATVKGKEMEQTTNYGNYQKLPEGIVFPLSIESGNGPMTIKTVDINKPVDESIFKPGK